MLSVKINVSGVRPKVPVTLRVAPLPPVVALPSSEMPSCQR